MKTYYIAVLLMLAGSVKAQGVKVKVIDATGVERWIDYVPTGTSKFYVDSAVGNKALQSYVNNAVANLQTLIATKADKGTTGTGEGQTISLPEQTWYKIIKPFDFGVKYSDGSVQGQYSFMGYSTHYGVNYRSNRPDQVLLIAGYNSNPNNGRKDTTDASWDISVETHFDIPTFLNPAFEFHTQRIKTKSGREVRGLSWYVDKVTGGGFHNFVTNSINAFVPGYENNEAYFIARDGQILLANNTPGNSGTGLFMKNDASMGGQTIELHQRGGVGVFKIPANKPMGANYSLTFNSFNGIAIGGGFYNSNAEAKTLGNLKPGDNYYTRINGIKVLAQVE